MKLLLLKENTVILVSWYFAFAIIVECKIYNWKNSFDHQYYQNCSSKYFEISLLFYNIKD